MDKMNVIPMAGFERYMTDPRGVGVNIVYNLIYDTQVFSTSVVMGIFPFLCFNVC